MLKDAIPHLTVQNFILYNRACYDNVRSNHCENDCKKDKGFAHLQSEGLQSIEYEHRNMFLQRSPDFGIPSFRLCSLEISQCFGREYIFKAALLMLGLGIVQSFY